MALPPAARAMNVISIRVRPRPSASKATLSQPPNLPCAKCHFTPQSRCCVANSDAAIYPSTLSAKFVFTSSCHLRGVQPPSPSSNHQEQSASGRDFSRRFAGFSCAKKAEQVSTGSRLRCFASVLFGCSSIGSVQFGGFGLWLAGVMRRRRRSSQL
jgi:hypothetical protein